MPNYTTILAFLRALQAAFHPADVETVIKLVEEALALGVDATAVLHAIYSHDPAAMTVALRKLLDDARAAQAAKP